MKSRFDRIFREYLRQAYILQLRFGSFSPKGLARETGKSYGRSSNIVTELLDKQYIKRVNPRRMLGSGGRSRLRGFAPAEYILAKKGRALLKVVLAGGVFDIIHPGHIATLSEARKHGDVLVVVLARDSTVKEKKRYEPVLDEEARLYVMSSLRPVDAAILGSKTSYLETLDRVSPDVICLGYDQKADHDYLKKLLKRTRKSIKIIRLDKRISGHSTSRVVRKIKGSLNNNNP